MGSSAPKVEMVTGIILNEYVSIVGPNDQSEHMCLRCGWNRREASRPEPPDSIFCRWTDRQFKVLVVWFRPEIQVDKNCDE